MLRSQRPLVLALVMTFAVASPTSARSNRARPTRAQIRAAVRGAERSRSLWATVNICNTARYPNVVGIRGQMPALGFNAQLRMYFGIDYRTRSSATFKPLGGVRQLVKLGAARHDVDQVGVRFRFQPHAGLLRGHVTFEWRMGTQTIARVDRVTRSGHPAAMFGDPERFSSATCLIP